RGVEVEVAADRQVEVEARAARGLDEGDEAQALEDLPDPKRQPARAGERAAVQLRLPAPAFAPRIEVGVQVEDDEIGIVEDRALGGMGQEVRGDARQIAQQIALGGSPPAAKAGPELLVEAGYGKVVPAQRQSGALVSSGELLEDRAGVTADVALGHGSPQR